MKKTLAFYVCILLSFNLSAQTWQVDAKNSKVQFTVAHMGIAELVGYFEDYKVQLKPVKEDLSEIAIDMEVATASINTGIEKRDEHLRSKDFFDTEQFPAMTFKSKTYKKGLRGLFKLLGDLTLLGVTKEIELLIKPGTNIVTDLKNKKRIGFVAIGVLKRSDFGLDFNLNMDNESKYISDEVEIYITMQFVQEN